MNNIGAGTMIKWYHMILCSSDTHIIADYGCNKHYKFFSGDPHDIVDYGYDKHYIYIHIYIYIYQVTPMILLVMDIISTIWLFMMLYIGQTYAIICCGMLWLPKQLAG